MKSLLMVLIVLLLPSVTFGQYTYRQTYKPTYPVYKPVVPAPYVAKSYTTKPSTPTHNYTITNSYPQQLIATQPYVYNSIQAQRAIAEYHQRLTSAARQLQDPAAFPGYGLMNEDHELLAMARRLDMLADRMIIQQRAAELVHIKQFRDQAAVLRQMAIDIVGQYPPPPAPPALEDPAPVPPKADAKEDPRYAPKGS